MGAADQGASPARLLRRHSARRDGGRFARLLRDLFRHHRRTGLRVAGRRGKLERHRSRSPGRPVGRSADAQMIRVGLPYHLRNLAKADAEVQLQVEGPVTQRTVLNALEARYPMLAGTIRDHVTQKRRAFLRFFACGEDLSLESPDAPLPEKVATGEEPFLIIGAIAGG